MADDDHHDIDDLLGGMDDLENSLFGRPSSASKQRKPAAPNPTSSLSIADTLFGGRNQPPSRKPTVTFQDSPITATSAEPVRKLTPTRTNLDSLFGDSTSTDSRADSANRPSRLQSGGLLGESRGRRDQSASQSQESSNINAVVSKIDENKIQRLETEIERQLREIDDLKRRRREDEEELERFWKDKLEKKEKECEKRVDDTKIQLENQLSKVNDEHKAELERIKASYERQLEAMQGVSGQSRDVASVVDKVQSLSSTIEHMAGGLQSMQERSLDARETQITLKETQLESREMMLKSDMGNLEEERRKVHELNFKLSDMLKNQEAVMEQEKWKVRDEWRKLKAERQIFQDEQRHLLDSMEKERKVFEQRKAKFYGEQHDLIVRLSSEKSMLRQEADEFYIKRDADVKRLKEEANALQNRIQQILSVEMNLENMKSHYDSKLRQLQELEYSLMEECVEIEKIRNQLGGVLSERSPRNDQRNSYMKQQVMIPTETEPETPTRNESVRTVLKKHAEYLEKYTGQKVAAVAPQTN